MHQAWGSDVGLGSIMEGRAFALPLFLLITSL
jgi:hypothetical protein